MFFLKKSKLNEESKIYRKNSDKIESAYHNALTDDEDDQSSKKGRTSVKHREYAEDSDESKPYEKHAHEKRARFSHF